MVEMTGTAMQRKRGHSIFLFCKKKVEVDFLHVESAKKTQDDFGSPKLGKLWTVHSGPSATASLSRTRLLDQLVNLDTILILAGV